MQPRFFKELPVVFFGKGHECAIEDKLPDNSEDDATDEVWYEEKSAQEIFATKLWGNKKCKAKSNYINENKWNYDEERRESESRPETWVCKWIWVVGKSN